MRPLNDSAISNAPPMAALILAGLALSVSAFAQRALAEPARSQPAQHEPVPAEPAPAEADRFRSTVAQSALREEAISKLLRLAAHSDPLIRSHAIEGLAPARSRLEAPLAAALKDENPGVRAIAAVVAGREGVSGAAPFVRGLTADPSPFVKASAIYAMRSLGTDQDATPLGVMLLEHADSRVRAHAAFLLGELGDKSALPMLRQALHDSPASATPQELKLLGLQIAEAMVKLGDTSRLEGIRAALYPAQPDEFEVAALAVQILGRLGDRNSIGALINLAEYQQGGRPMPAEFRLAIADAVARMGRREGWFIAEEFAADDDPLRRSLAAHVFGQTRRPEDLAWLDGMMDDPDASVQTSAAAGVLEATRPANERSSVGVP